MKRKTLLKKLQQEVDTILPKVIFYYQTTLGIPPEITFDLIKEKLSRGDKLFLFCLDFKSKHNHLFYEKRKESGGR
jgi:hypothetical protein